MKTHWFKKTVIILSIIAISIAAYYFFTPKKTIEYVTQDAITSDIEQIVSVNGTVESNSKIRLRFQQPGKVAKIFFEIGDKILENDTLASLDNDKYKSLVDQAASTVNMYEAELNLKYAGPSYEAIKVSDTQIEQAQVNLNNAETKLSDTILANEERIRKSNLELENAKIALDNAEKNLNTSGGTITNTKEIAESNLSSSYIDSDTALVQAVDAIDRAITSADTILGIDNKIANDDYEDRLGTKDPSANIIAIQSYSKAMADFAILKTENEKLKALKLSATQDEIRTQIDNTLLVSETSLFITKDLLDKTYFLLDATPTNYIFTLERLEELKARIEGEQTSISTNLQNIQKIMQTITTAKLDLTKVNLSGGSNADDASANYEKAKNNLLIAESNLKSAEVQNKIDEHTARMQIDSYEVQLKQTYASHAQLIADPRAVDVAGIKAQINSALSSLKQTQKDLDDTVIKAPISGTITEVNSKVGENVSSAENVVVMITDKLQIKANISETDINKLEVGNNVDVSFDSLPEDQIFTGRVITVNPAETVIDGVIYYEATVVLDKDDPRIKSGMTADMDIHTAFEKGVVAIPSLAVEYTDGQAFAFVLINGQKEKRDIKVGIEGKELIEVKEGIRIGEKIIIYEK